MFLMPNSASFTPPGSRTVSACSWLETSSARHGLRPTKSPCTLQGYTHSGGRAIDSIELFAGSPGLSLRNLLVKVFSDSCSDHLKLRPSGEPEPSQQIVYWIGRDGKVLQTPWHLLLSATSTVA